jgi:hypothetical protein
MGWRKNINATVRKPREEETKEGMAKSRKRGSKGVKKD